MAKTPAWQRKEGKNPKGGLNQKVEIHIIVQLEAILKHLVKRLATKDVLVFVQE